MAPSDCIRVFGMQGSKRDPAPVRQDLLALSMTFEQVRLEPVSKNPEIGLCRSPENSPGSSRYASAAVLHC